MRATDRPTLISFLLLLLLPFTLAVFKDEAYVNDWHLALLGPSIPQSTFFHPPAEDSKATLIYTLSTRSILAAINPKDGELVWRQDRAAFRSSSSTPGVAKPGTNVIVSAVGQNIAAFSASSGKLIWERTFESDIIDLELLAENGVVVIHADGVIRTLQNNGENAWEREAGEAKYPLHSVFVKDDKVTVVASKPAPETHLMLSVMQLQGVYEMAQSMLHQVPLSTHILGKDIRAKNGVLAWEEFGSLKVVLPTAEFPRPVEVKMGKDVKEWDIVATETTVVVVLKTESKAWAEVLKTEQPRGLKKGFEIREREGEHGSVFSVSQKDGKEFIVWTLTSGETVLYSTEAYSPLKSYPAVERGLPLAGTQLENAISEVVVKTDGSHGFRTFLTANAPGFNGDTHIIRNGEVAWVRKESLSSIVASTWLELLDPTTEEIVDELKVETHKNVVAAYVHRVVRHAHELAEYGPAWASALPQRVLNAFLSVDNEKPAFGKWRDFFGFRKFLIVVTAEGGLAALDVSKKGEVVWRASLRAKDVEWAGTNGIWAVRKGVVGIITKTGFYDEYNAFEGVLLGQVTLGEPVVETAVVAVEGGSAIIAALESGEIAALPQGVEIQKPVYMVTRHASGAVEGLQISPDLKSTVTWSFSPPGDEVVTSISTRPAHDPIASIGRVLGDRSVMYKYINPHLLVLSTISTSTDSASVYILDSVSGTLLHSAVHTDVDTSLPILATVSENFVVHTYFSVASPTGAQGHNLVVAELYESPHPNDRGPLDANETVSSFKTTGKPYTYTQSWIYPARISSLAVTYTKQGITAKNILAFLPNHHSIASIPKRILDPRRPVNRDPDNAEREEGLMKYNPVVDLDPRSLISHERDVVGVKVITTSPSDLESTSLVVAWGGDLFVTREAPSLVFDLLGKGFGKLQLVGTVVAVGIAARLLEPMVRRRGIDARWRA